MFLSIIFSVCPTPCGCLGHWWKDTKERRSVCSLVANDDGCSGWSTGSEYTQVWTHTHSVTNTHTHTHTHTGTSYNSALSHNMLVTTQCLISFPQWRWNPTRNVTMSTAGNDKRNIKLIWLPSHQHPKEGRKKEKRKRLFTRAMNGVSCIEKAWKHVYQTSLTRLIVYVCFQVFHWSMKQAACLLRMRVQVNPHKHSSWWKVSSLHTLYQTEQQELVKHRWEIAKEMAVLYMYYVLGNCIKVWAENSMIIKFGDQTPVHNQGTNASVIGGFFIWL